jgi:type II secretory pathway pseudopilin PulG
MLVVLVIVTLLLALLLPAINAARLAGKVASQKSRIRIIEQACRQFSTDFRGVFPGPYTNSAIRTGSVQDDQMPTPPVVQPSLVMSQNLVLDLFGGYVGGTPDGLAGGPGTWGGEVGSTLNESLIRSGFGKGPRRPLVSFHPVAATDDDVADTDDNWDRWVVGKPFNGKRAPLGGVVRFPLQRTSAPYLEADDDELRYANLVPRQLNVHQWIPMLFDDFSSDAFPTGRPILYFRASPSQTRNTIVQSGVYSILDNQPVQGLVAGDPANLINATTLYNHPEGRDFNLGADLLVGGVDDLGADNRPDTTDDPRDSELYFWEQIADPRRQRNDDGPSAAGPGNDEDINEDVVELAIVGGDDPGNDADEDEDPVNGYYNEDSFLLISAGPDGIYGTDDDITNYN